MADAVWTGSLRRHIVNNSNINELNTTISSGTVVVESGNISIVDSIELPVTVNSGEITTVTGSVTDATIVSPLDNRTGSLITIDYAHHEIHEGTAFNWEYLDLAIDDDDYLVVTIETPPDKYMHFTWNAQLYTSDSTPDVGQFFGVQASGVAISGTVLAASCRNKASGTISTSVITYQCSDAYVDIFTTPTVTYGPTMVQPGGRKIGAGSVAGKPEEWVIPNNSTFAAILQNTTGSAAAGEIELEWYEKDV